MKELPLHIILNGPIARDHGSSISEFPHRNVAINMLAHGTSVDPTRATDDDPQVNTPQTDRVSCHHNIGNNVE